jgi:hypothetical protein
MLWLSRRPEWQRSREFETTTRAAHAAQAQGWEQDPDLEEEDGESSFPSVPPHPNPSFAAALSSFVAAAPPPFLAAVLRFLFTVLPCLCGAHGVALACGPRA